MVRGSYATVAARQRMRCVTVGHRPNNTSSPLRASVGNFRTLTEPDLRTALTRLAADLVPPMWPGP